jgi:hypothetical protein
MFASKALSLISLLAASTSLVNANGCYSHGPTFSDIGGNVDATVERFCRDFIPRTLAPRQTVSTCYGFGDLYGLEMLVQNLEGVAKGLSYEECYQSFEIERTACSHGSEQVHGSFWYRIDPNDGSC